MKINIYFAFFTVKAIMSWTKKEAVVENLIELDLQFSDRYFGIDPVFKIIKGATNGSGYIEGLFI